MIRRAWPDPEDSFRVPFIVENWYYHVPQVNSKKEGLPTILNLRDLTGEGVATEFVLFMYEACGIAATSVFGYSRQFDRAVQYGVEIVHNSQESKIQVWVGQIFAAKPVRPGYWDFTWNPGHGADVKIHEQVSFDRARQLFVDKQEITPYP